MTGAVCSGISEGDLLLKIFINYLESEMENEAREIVDITKLFRFVKKNKIEKGCGKIQ